MNKFIIVDIETGGFDIISGIYEVAAIVVEDMEIVDKLHIGIVEDEELIGNGYGEGYEDISYNEKCILQFSKFIDKYKYPIIAHNASFDRKFLVYYEWISEEYIFYDSVRAIKYEMPYLFSHSMSYILEYMNIEKEQQHTAIDDVLDLYNIIKIIEPEIWIPIGVSKKRKYSQSDNKKMTIDKENIEIISDIFKDKNIVFTGKGPYKRDYLSIIAIQFGATVLNKVSKNTDILVVGEEAGSKLQKAEDIGIEILSIDDFMDLTSETDIIDIMKDNTISKPKVKTSREKYEYKNKDLKDMLVSLVPMRLKMAEKVGGIIESLGGDYMTTLRKKETNLLIYEKYGEDYATVARAKENGIEVLSLSEFNKLLVEENLKIKNT